MEGEKEQQIHRIWQQKNGLDIVMGVINAPCTPASFTSHAPLTPPRHRRCKRERLKSFFSLRRVNLFQDWNQDAGWGRLLSEQLSRGKLDTTRGGNKLDNTER